MLTTVIIGIREVCELCSSNLRNCP